MDKSQTDPSPKTYRVLALGDSYTIGEGVSESEPWPAQLATRLRIEGIPVEEPLIVAASGWTTRELLAGIQKARPTRTFDVVFLQIGVNNQYRGLAKEQFECELDDLIDQAVGFASEDPSRVVVLSIPDWSVTPFAEGHDRVGISTEIDRFNQRKLQRTRKRGCHFVDVTTLSRAASNNLSLLATDGLHPSGLMYARWCEVVLPVTRLALGLPREQ